MSDAPTGRTPLEREALRLPKALPWVGLALFATIGIAVLIAALLH